MRLNTWKRYIALIAIPLFASVPITFAVAQSGDTLAGSDVPVQATEEPVIIELPESTDVPPTQETIAADTVAPADAGPLLDTVSDSQSTIPGDALVQTLDPSELSADTASSSAPIEQTEQTESIVLPDSNESDASSTPVVVPDTGSSPDNGTAEESLSADVGVALVDDTQSQPVVADIPMQDIAPKKQFTFVVKSERIATAQSPAWRDRGVSKGKRQSSTADQPISTGPSITMDASSGVPIVSGHCTDVFYVILLFKNETDYNLDPASYVVNRAYRCENGQFSHPLKDVPRTVQNGTYYLMVGSMGETGSWTPVTSLVPIEITR